MSTDEQSHDIGDGRLSPQIIAELGEVFADYIWRHVSRYIETSTLERITRRVTSLRGYLPTEIPSNKEIIKGFARHYRPLEVLEYCLGPEGLIDYVSAEKYLNVDDYRKQLITQGYSGDELRLEVKNGILRRILLTIVRLQIEFNSLTDLTSSTYVEQLTDSWLKFCERLETINTSTALLTSVSPPQSNSDLTEGLQRLYIRYEQQGDKLREEIRKQSEMIRQEVKEGNNRINYTLTEIIDTLWSFRDFYQDQVNTFDSRMGQLQMETRSLRQIYKEHDEFARGYAERFEKILLEDLRPISIDNLIANIKADLNDETLSEESLSFIAASQFVEGLVSKEKSPGLDYSIAAIGLWKFSERELRERFIRTLTTQGQIIFRTAHPSKPHWRFNIEEQNHLITLGTILFAVTNDRRRAKRNNWHPENEYILLNESWQSNRELLVAAIRDISELRNSHAHINRMNYDDYIKLKEIVFTGSRNITPLTAWIGKL